MRQSSLLGVGVSKKKKQNVRTPNQWSVVDAEIPQTPVASDTVPDSASKQRFFMSDWKEQFDWLENNEETKKKKMFCTSCRLKDSSKSGELYTK